MNSKVVYLCPLRMTYKTRVISECGHTLASLYAGAYGKNIERRKQHGKVEFFLKGKLVASAEDTKDPVSENCYRGIWVIESSKGTVGSLSAIAAADSKSLARGLAARQALGEKGEPPIEEKQSTCGEEYWYYRFPTEPDDGESVFSLCRPYSRWLLETKQHE